MTLKEYRGKRPLREIAEEFNCSIAAISKYEHGERVQCVSMYIKEHNLPIELNEPDTVEQFLKDTIVKLKKEITHLEKVIDDYKEQVFRQEKIIKQYKEKIAKLKEYINARLD